MTEDETLWIAGILEGEGSFSYHVSVSHDRKRKRKLRIRLSMTDIDIIIRARNIMNPSGSFRRDERSAQIFKDGYKRKDTYILSIEGEKAATVMRAILPYMGKRRAERIESSLYQWDNGRKGPVYVAPTAQDLADAADILATIGLE